MKVVAVWLHATGVGLFSIYSSVIETITTFSSLGLRQSTVPDIARAQNAPGRLQTIMTIVRRWSHIAGLIGAVAISAAAPFLAKSFFGEWDMCWGFVALSTAMFMNALLDGEQAILQGSGMLKSLAKGSMSGTCCGLLLSIPMFWFWREASVVPSIIVYSAASLIFTLIYRRKGCKSDAAHTSFRQTWKEGKSFVRLGIYMATATFITNISHLIFLTFLNNTASTEEVGYYHAGSTLIIRYVGLIFTAIGMEFFPRLAANHQSALRVKLFVSHEISILLLVLTPVILLFLLCREWIIDLLYAESFKVIVPFISWAILCSIFKAVSWCMAFTIIAKGDGAKYVITEGVDAAIGLGLNILFYNIFGLVGIGIAYILWYLAYCLIVGVVYYNSYGLSLSSDAIKSILLCLLICSGAFVCVEFLPLWASIAILLPTSAVYIIKLKQVFTGKSTHK